MVHQLNEATAQIAAALDSVAEVSPIFADPGDRADVLRDLAALETRLVELRLRVMAASHDVAADDGAKNIATWLSAQTRLRGSDLRADLRLAEALDHERPRLAQAVRSGEVNIAQARVIVRAVDDLPVTVDPATVALAEAKLVDYAASFDPTGLHRLGRKILDTVAPEIAEAHEAAYLAQLEECAQRQARLTLRALGDGTTRLSARLPDAAAARLATYLHAFTNPRRPDGTTQSTAQPTSQSDRTAGASPATADPDQQALAKVPYPRRAAHAFAELLETLDPQRLPLQGGDATTVVVTIGLDALRSGLGTAMIDNPLPGDGDGTITAAQARRLACQAGIIPVVLDGDSQPVDVGRTRRLHTAAQRKALRIRDRRCRAQGCTVPAPWCHAHHKSPWHTGGSTTVEDGILLCPHHHRCVHDPDYVHHYLPDGDVTFHRRTPRHAMAARPIVAA